MRVSGNAPELTIACRSSAAVSFLACIILAALRPDRIFLHLFSLDDGRKISPMFMASTAPQPPSETLTGAGPQLAFLPIAAPFPAQLAGRQFLS